MFLTLSFNQKINHLASYLFCFFVTIIFLDILNFDYPSSSLDGSWHYYMTYAFLNKLSFTKDIIFTYGPLGFLHAKTYIPGIFYQHILLSLCIIIPYTNSLFEYLSNKNLKIIVIPLLMLFFLNKEVAFFIFYLIVYENLKNKEKINIKDYLNLIPIYLFPFIKTVFLIPSAILFLFLIFSKNKSQILYFTISSIFFTYFFWLIGGQEILSLFNYLFNFLNIMNGYSENLSIFGNKYEIIIALILIILILLNLHIHKLPLFDFIFYLLFFFLLFKVGFVRHDGHAVKFFGYVLFFSLILFNLKKKINLILISFLFFTYIFSLNLHNLNSFYLDRVKNIGHTFSSLIDIGLNFKNYIDDNDQRFLKSKNKIIEDFDFSSYSNKVVDIYNYNQGIVIANETIPGFRPQFQSFNASNSFLIEKNLNHLKIILQNIFFLNYSTSIIIILWPMIP